MSSYNYVVTAQPPTAVLHWWTGFTLLFANAHARSLE